MITDNQIIRYIFGFKVRYLRQQKGLSYQELSNATGLSTSYLNDIEKGKRYPKPGKINAMGEALGVDYNYLVATNASKKLQPIIDLLQSKFFQLFPLEDFGISVEKLLELFTFTPDKVNAFISTIFKIARNYQVNEERFYLEALRSYQDMHNNHFPELDEAADNFRNINGISEVFAFSSETLEEKLKTLYSIEVDRERLSILPTLKGLRSYYDKKKKTLFLQKDLAESQENFLIARELGFQFLELTERPFETTIIKINSFEQLLNNYKASHFAAALLLHEEELVRDIRQIAQHKTWLPKLFLNLLEKYNVTAETLLQRLTNVFPHHFGIEDLFFIRLSEDKDLKSFRMQKDLHLAQLHNPYNNQLNEHYCNRWVSITSIKELRFQPEVADKRPIKIDAQISKYWGTNKEYLCISLARSSFKNPQKGVSVTIGLLINPHLRSILYFLNDPALKYREVHTTCERCGIVDCEARVAHPTVIEEEQRKLNLIQTLSEI